MLEKVVTYDHGVTEDFFIQIRRITRIMEDGVELSKTYHRETIEPGLSVEGRDPMTIALAAAVHTKDNVEAHIATLAAMHAKMNAPT